MYVSLVICGKHVRILSEASCGTLNDVIDDVIRKVNVLECILFATRKMDNTQHYVKFYKKQPVTSCMPLVGP